MTRSKSSKKSQDDGGANPSNEAEDPTRGMFDGIQSIAGVIEVIPGDVSPEERARARQMLDALQKIRDAAPQTAVEAQASPSSDITPSGAKRKRTKLDDALAAALSHVGYRRIAKFTYRGEWSTPVVEHVLTFDAYGVPKVYLSGDAGLRNPQASAFADQCLSRYGTPQFLKVLRESGYVYPPWWCQTHFPIGRLFGWKVRSSLDMTFLSSEDAASSVAKSVAADLLPLVRRVVSLETFLDFLARNEEPLLWVRAGPGTQAAIVAYLACAVGCSRVWTRAQLLRDPKLMLGSIDSARLTPEAYVDHILDDAEAAVAEKGA